MPSPRVPEPEPLTVVADVMSGDVVSVGPDSTLSAAAQMMMERAVGSAVVMNGDQLAGIITERDVLRSVALGLVPWSTRVSESMTATLVTAEPAMPAKQALELMMSRGFRHLPVMEGKRVVGLVSMRDLLRHSRVAGI